MKEGIYIMLNDDSTFLVRVEGTAPYLKVATVLDLKEFEKGEVKKVKLTDSRVKSLMEPGTIYKPVIADRMMTDNFPIINNAEYTERTGRILGSSSFIKINQLRVKMELFPRRFHNSIYIFLSIWALG